MINLFVSNKTSKLGQGAGGAKSVFVVSVPSDATVAALKAAIQAETQIPPQLQALYCHDPAGNLGEEMVEVGSLAAWQPGSHRVNRPPPTAHRPPPTAYHRDRRLSRRTPATARGETSPCRRIAWRTTM